MLEYAPNGHARGGVFTDAERDARDAWERVEWERARAAANAADARFTYADGPPPGNRQELLPRHDWAEPAGWERDRYGGADRYRRGEPPVDFRGDRGDRGGYPPDDRGAYAPQRHRGGYGGGTLPPHGGPKHDPGYNPPFARDGGGGGGAPRYEARGAYSAASRGGENPALGRALGPVACVQCLTPLRRSPGSPPTTPTPRRRT